MARRIIAALLLVISVLMLVGCQITGNTSTDNTNKTQSETASDNKDIDLPDGVYEVDFKTDSTMFKLNETCKGKAKLTVKDGYATVHIVLPSTNFVNLFLGTADDAKKDDAVLLEPVAETVTYGDGEIDTAYSFDVPVKVIGEEFDLAVIGTKGKWYDHKVIVENPVKINAQGKIITDGTYEIAVTLEGGSGKASIQSPTELYVQEGDLTAKIVWSSANYDYMIVAGHRYEPEIIDGHSVFVIPISGLDTEIKVIADTTAMSKPYEIEYTLVFDSSTMIPVK